MRAREELARSANNGLSRQTSTQTYEQEETPSEMIASIVETYHEEMAMKDSTPGSQHEAEISEEMVKPDICNYKLMKGQENLKSTVTSKSILTQTGSLFMKPGQHTISQDKINQRQYTPQSSNTNSGKEYKEMATQVLEVLHSETLCRDSSLESLYLDHEYSDLSLIKDEILDGASIEKQESEYEFNFMFSDNALDKCGYTDLKILAKINDLSSVSSEDGYVSPYNKSTSESLESEELCKSSNQELPPVPNGDYLLNNLPKRPKPPSRRPSAKNRYRYEPESGDNEVQPLMVGFKLPNEAVIKAREMNLIGTEECFGNTD